MSSHEAYKKIEPISGSDTTKHVDMGPSASTGEEGPSKVKFDEAVSHADPSKIERRGVSFATEPAVSQTQKPTLMEVATKVTQEPAKVTPTPKELAAQTIDLRREIERPKAVLIAEMKEHPTVVGNLGLEDLNKMQGHITHADRGLQEVSKLTTGVETGSSISPAEISPAVRFLSFLTESDQKLNHFVDELSNLQVGSKRLSPATLLAVQVKLGFIQNELEFFTATLNKALDSTKTIMNIQI